MLTSKVLMKKLGEAYDIYAYYKHSQFLEEDSLCSELLFHVFESLRLKDDEIFKAVMDTFNNTLARDPDIEKIVKKIGSIYFGISDGSGMDIMSMLGSMLG